MELNAGQDVKPISDFRKDAARVLKRLKETRNPVLLTQHGRSVAVLIDIDEFERMEYERKFARAIAEGLEDVSKGRTRSHQEVARETQRSLERP